MRKELVILGKTNDDGLALITVDFKPTLGLPFAILTARAEADVQAPLTDGEARAAFNTEVSENGEVLVYGTSNADFRLYAIPDVGINALGTMVNVGAPSPSLPPPPMSLRSLVEESADSTPPSRSTRKKGPTARNH